LDKKNDLSKNLKLKQDLINKLKELINLDTKINEKYLRFKEIQNEWFKIGPVPRVQNIIIWNTFQHHNKNFYDYLHLNRKFKEIDIKYNLDQKKITIEQGKKLIEIEDKVRAFKYFERLNKKWKFEIGPTKKEDEVILNQEFKEIGKLIFENKITFDKNKDSILNENFLKKETLLNEIKALIEVETNSTKEWQKNITSFEKIKNQIEKTGPITFTKQKEYWSNYKSIIREFYKKKNDYFKDLKKVYQKNISLQESIIIKIEELTSNDDLNTNRKEVVSLQLEWKKINPVPYKINQKNWKKFKTICDVFFNKINHQKESIANEFKINENKQIEILKEIENHDKTNKEDINILINKWRKSGKASSKHETEFDKKIKKIFKDSGLNEQESINKLLETKLGSMNEKEKKFEIHSLNKKSEILKKELTLLENNISFFNYKSKENKILDKVRREIEKKKKGIESIIQTKKKLNK
jgi:hypothetical protein|tara:strand:+ start:10870 stop:12273 length:1404 start_codon:yes stop_codon:yes gene_type:complete